MSNIFHRKIRSAQANPILQAALDANAERRVSIRRAAFASMPDHEELRQRAHHMRASVIANLDGYFEQFVERARENGMTVHRAGDGAEASQTVLDIANQNGVRLAAKSKTMVSEEIHLNQVLEQGGIQVVETDLGEYIVQLRGEPPAHIITPAVHLRRKEVGETFHEKLGIPLTEDIPTLTAAARLHLRKVFLEAGLGISGVNFGVADTGTLCILTNEGNGRMVTSLPPVHIALMGIERLVPNLDDLALMLELLPRSATGQKITVYTNLIHGPALPSDSDGPRQRHVVLVDNGRRALLNTPLAEILYCIRCGACLNACPVFREIGGHGYVGKHGQVSPYPGPLGAVLSPALFGAPEFGHLARASSLCGACKEACPVDIDLPKLLLRVRAGLIHPDSPTELPASSPVSNAPAALKAGLRLFRHVSLKPGLFSTAVRAAGVSSRLPYPRGSWLRLPAATGWGYSKDFPRPAVRPFRERWKDRFIQGKTDLEGRHLPAEYPALGRTEMLHGTAEPEPKGTAEFGRSETGSTRQPGFEQDLVERFRVELEALGGRFVACSADELPDQIWGFLVQRRIDSIQSWSPDHLPEGLLERLEEKGITSSLSPDPALRAGLSGALVGAAETGSILVASGEGRPLAASLLPETHLAVLPAGKIRRSLAEALAVPELRSARAAAFISGPSRTADIEMTLTIGVHGPGEVVIFCLC